MGLSALSTDQNSSWYLSAAGLKTPNHKGHEGHEGIRCDALSWPWWLLAAELDLTNMKDGVTTWKYCCRSA